jgi:5'-deoxynucleotidase YfbR-like HD superfamily hydrolase
MVDLLDPQPEDININDIAWGLANTCRFSGQMSAGCRIDVAIHSVRVARCTVALGWGGPDVRMAALLHDAAEAYICDLPSPLKKLLPDYQAIEQRLQEVIYRRFEVKDDLIAALLAPEDQKPKESPAWFSYHQAATVIKKSDEAVLKQELNMLQGERGPQGWVRNCCAESSYDIFLDHFKDLQK